VLEVTEGWSRVARVVSMAPAIPAASRVDFVNVTAPLRYYETEGSPHNKPDEGLVCEECKTALSFPRPNPSFQRTASCGR